MGLCASTEPTDGKGSVHSPQELNRNENINKELESARQQDARVKKLLLLGPGASGKTTIYKQLVNLYGEKYDEEKLLSYRPIIYTNILQSIRTLCKWSNSNPEYAVSEANQKWKQLVLESKDDEDVIAPEFIRPLDALWKDPGIQAAFKNNSSKYLTSVLETISYWMAKLDEVTKDTYVPTLQDVLRSRAPTTGIVETEFEIEGSHFVMIDVGGQRNERKKWIHCFEGVTSVIYVASLNCYDQSLFEEENDNAMLEALKLFEDTINLPFFRSTDVILFLNKSDLFREKIKHVPLTVIFPEYNGGQEFDACVGYIEEEFRLRVKDPDKDLYCHVTCATDTSNVQFTFNAVKNIIIRKGLSEAGIMG